MFLLVTSASGASGNGFGALLAFELDGSLRGTFIDDDRIADPRGLAVDAKENLLFLNSGADRVLAISSHGRVVRETGRIEGLNPGGGNFGPDGRYFIGLRSARTIVALSTSLDAAVERVLPPRVVPFPRGFAFGHDGPSRAFLRYIAQVLPSLGEEAVLQSTVADIAPRSKVRAEDPFDVRRVKGDPRMALVLARSLEQRRRPIEEDVVLRACAARCTLFRQEVNDLAAVIAGGSAPYKAGRLALRARLVSLARQKVRASGRLDADQSWYESELTASAGFRDLLDDLWPSVSPMALVTDLLTSTDRLGASAKGILADSEWRRLLRSSGHTSGRQGWTIDDLALLDEATYLVNGRSRTYGHIVVDEAQDLTPMQFKMVARRAPKGSLTILGDLAQATGAWSYGSWDEILQHLPATASVRRDELTLGYRAPGQVLDLASKLLPVAAPTVQPTQSIRRGTRAPNILKVDRDRLSVESLAEAISLAGEDFLVGLVVPGSHLAPITKLARGRSDIGLLERDGMERRVTLVAATAVKGLEFDAVVVVEPAAIAGDDARGLRLLYVAMTRPIQHLSMVHADPLPALLLS